MGWILNLTCLSTPWPAGSALCFPFLGVLPHCTEGRGASHSSRLPKVHGFEVCKPEAPNPGVSRTRHFRGKGTWEQGSASSAGNTDVSDLMRSDKEVTLSSMPLSAISLANPPLSSMSIHLSYLPFYLSILEIEFRSDKAGVWISIMFIWNKMNSDYLLKGCQSDLVNVRRRKTCCQSDCAGALCPLRNEVNLHLQ